MTNQSKAYPAACSGCGYVFKKGDGRFNGTMCQSCSYKNITHIAIKLGKSGDQVNNSRATDSGNAINFAKRWMHDVVYVPEAKAWFVWNGKVWEKDHDLIQMMLLAKITVDGMYSKAAKITDKEVRDAALAWCKQSESVVRQKAMIESAKSLMKTMRYNDFDNNTHLFNAKNCTIDLRTKETHPHRREDYLTIINDFDYDPKATMPRGERFLEEINPGHAACCKTFLQRWFGYCLTGETSEECFAVLYGPLGRNGKGTLTETVCYVMGDWVGYASFDAFVVTRGNEKLNDIAGFRGKRMLVASESEASKRLAEAKIKKMTGGDNVTGEFKYEEQFSYRPTYKVNLISNYKPKIVGTDNGIWDRIKLIEFPVYFGDVISVYKAFGTLT